MTKIKSDKEHTDPHVVNNIDEITGGDEYPHCEGAPCANMADEDGEQSDITSGVTEQETENEWRDKYLRLSAEFDNYRKRTLREKMELITQGGEDVIKAVLPVLDDIDRALEVMDTAADIESVRTGIKLISNKLRDTLAHKGLKEIEAMGEEFDTDLHEAIAKIPVEKRQKGRVVDIAQRGYTLKDKVIRHTKVVVGE